MAENQQREFLKLVRKYNAGKASPKEMEILERYYALFDDEPGLSAEKLDRLDERIKNGIRAKIQKQERGIRRLPYRVAIAASILIIFGLGYLFIPKKQMAPQVAQRQDILPGHNAATLTLANGKKIVLTQNLRGMLAQQGNMQVGINNHTLAYAAVASNSDQPVTYNTESTKAGEQSPYPLILSDGTQVLLDAKSSITFPVTFNGIDRRVSITGKAWFKVNPIKNRPFYVETKGQVTKEIGTEFVIDAYDDEPAIRTTLIEGSILVNNILLKPGQQANNNGAVIKLNDANINETLAWVHGNFRYNDENIQYIMRELARWYDIDVQYQGNISTDGFNGKISRNKNISQVLNMLASTQLVHFKVDGRRVTVTQ